MSCLKLIKLLYLVDREALLRWGRPVTTDRHVSMPKGPAVSQTYDLIVGGNPPGTHTYWHDYISEPENFEVSLCRDPGGDELSPAEETSRNGRTPKEVLFPSHTATSYERRIGPTRKSPILRVRLRVLQ
jgi:hypothetical protein